MTNEIVPTNTIIRTMDDVERAARAMAASGFFPDSKQTAQAIVKILAGQELGFGPFASMTGVAIVQGKPSIGANLMAAAVKRTGKYNYRVAELTDQACELTFFESGVEVGRSRFTIQDAAAAQLSGKDNWKKYPRNMLFARALSNGQRWYAPDVFNGATVYTSDELGATVNEDGNLIDAQIVNPPASNGHEAEQEDEPENTLPEISYETAVEVTNSMGIRYGDLDTNKLGYMWNSISKRIRDNNLTRTELDGLLYKKSAIQAIIAERGKVANPDAG